MPRLKEAPIAKKKPQTEVLKEGLAQPLNLRLAGSDELGVADHKDEIILRHVSAMALTV